MFDYVLMSRLQQVILRCVFEQVRLGGMFVYLICLYVLEENEMVFQGVFDDFGWECVEIALIVLFGFQIQVGLMYWVGKNFYLIIENVYF